MPAVPSGRDPTSPASTKRIVGPMWTQTRSLALVVTLGRFRADEAGDGGPVWAMPTTMVRRRISLFGRSCGLTTRSVAAPRAKTRANLIEFTVDGAGPYQLGATLTALQSVPGLDEIKAGGATCPQNVSARGTGSRRDVHLSFRSGGVLYLAVNRSPAIPTPSGAWVRRLPQLKTIYAKVTAEELVRDMGRGYLVTALSGRARQRPRGSSRADDAEVRGQPA
jgi:hypothetical protein